MAIAIDEGTAIAEQVNEHLQTYLAAKLTALESEYLTDPITIEPLPLSNYHLNQVQVPPNFPLVCTYSESTDKLPQGVGAQQEDFEYHYLVVALAVTANQQEDRIKRYASRLLRAFQEILHEHSTLTGQISYLFLLRKAYLPLIVLDSALLQEAQLHLMTASVREF